MGINEDDVVKRVYDEREEVIKIISLRRKRRTIRIGRKISIEEIEEAIEGMMDEAIFWSMIQSRIVNIMP